MSQNTYKGVFIAVI